MSYTQILYPRLRELLKDGAQLIEVLPAGEYAELHLPGARNIPLKTLDAHSTSDLDRDRAVVVYCWDALCDMSPRAACRLSSLGFEAVYDYMPSKVDWLARGLPVEGENASEPRALDLARHDIVTCELHDTIGDLRERIQQSPYGFALVLGADRVLMGRLRKSVLQGSSHARAEDVMESGPSTTRPDTPPAELLQKLQRADLSPRFSATPMAG